MKMTANQIEHRLFAMALKQRGRGNLLTVDLLDQEELYKLQYDLTILLNEMNQARLAKACPYLYGEESETNTTPLTSR